MGIMFNMKKKMQNISDSDSTNSSTSAQHLSAGTPSAGTRLATLDALLLEPLPHPADERMRMWIQQIKQTSGCRCQCGSSGIQPHLLIRWICICSSAGSALAAASAHPDAVLTAASGSALLDPAASAL